MCVTLKDKTKKKTAYKVVVKLNNKYYSPNTGVEIKVGKVIADEQILQKISDKFRLKDKLKISWAEVFRRKDGCHSWLYNPEYLGYTSGFLSVKDAKKHLSNNQFAIVKITFKGETLKGRYQSSCGAFDVLAGKELVKVEEV